NRSLNRYLYRETYNYQRTLRAASRRLSTMLELRPLLDYLHQLIETTFKAEHVTVYLRDPVGSTFSASATELQHQQWHRVPSHLVIPSTSPLVACLRSDPATLVFEEARTSHDDRVRLAADGLRELSGEVALPLTGDQALLGFVMVGPKRSGDPYFTDD